MRCDLKVYPRSKRDDRLLLNISVGNGEDGEDEVDTSWYQTCNVFKEEENRSFEGGTEDGVGDGRGEGADVSSLISLPLLSLLLE
jgi:hypothetical protein